MRRPVRHRPLAGPVLALALLAPLALAGCGGAEDDALNGYAEAEYVRVGPSQTGRIETLAVGRGATVRPGDRLFTLDPTQEQAARDEAAARLAQAEAQLADRLTGRRPEELAVYAAQLDEAKASLRFLEEDLQRQQRLVATNVAARRDLDEMRSSVDMGRARVAQLTAQLAVARLPARADEIAAARSAVTAAESALAQAEWRLSERAVVAPVGGLVEDTLYRPGETVTAGAPVVSLLPPGNVKLRFFVPERRLSTIGLGQTVAVACDGCPPGLTATITYIAPEAEYTPPVIYSVTSSDKLVYLVEARPDGEAARLHPGQPVDIRLTAP